MRKLRNAVAGCVRKVHTYLTRVQPVVSKTCVPDVFWASGIYIKVDTFTFGLWYIFSWTSLFGSVVRVVATLCFASHPSGLTFIVLSDGDFFLFLFGPRPPA